MKKVLNAALLIALSVGVVRADEGAAKAVLDGLSGFQEQLTSDTRFGVYMNTKRVGEMSYATERAEEGSGAVYKQTAAMTMTFGELKYEIEAVLLLDEKLAVVQGTEIEHEPQPDGSMRTTKKVTRRDGDTVVREVTVDGGETKRFEIAATHADHDESTQVVLSAFGTKPGTYTLHAIAWPGANGDGAASWREVSVVVSAAKEVTHRGKTITAHEVLTRKGDEETKLLVSTSGAMLSVVPADAPIQLVAGTAEEVAKDLPAPKTDTSGVKTSLEAAVIYLKVLSQQLPVANLDRVMDWDYIYDEACKTNPDVGGVSREQFAEILKVEFGKEATVSPDDVNLIIPQLEVQEKGSKAVITLPNGKTFELVKREDGSWRIRSFPKG